MTRQGILAFAFILSLSSCASTDGAPGTEPKGVADTLTAVNDVPKAIETDRVDVVKAPKSVRAAEPIVFKPPDSREQLRERLVEVGGDDLLAVRARVEKVSVSRRKLPERLYWGPMPHIVTTLKLRILEDYCGDGAESISASYVGGRLADGSIEVTEQMPPLMAVGMEHVFFLRRVGGEYFLELGRDDMLTRDSEGRFVDASAKTIELKYIREICP